MGGRPKLTPDAVSIEVRRINQAHHTFRIPAAALIEAAKDMLRDAGCTVPLGEANLQIANSLLGRDAACLLTIIEPKD